MWWRRSPRASSRFVQTHCPAIQGFVSYHQTLLTNYNCNYGQEERKRKGNTTVLSNTACESTEPLQTQVWVVCKGSTAEQKPSLKVGDCHGRKALSAQEEKSGAQQGSRGKIFSPPWKRFFHSFAIPNAGSLYPQIKVFLWVSAFKAWTSHW